MGVKPYEYIDEYGNLIKQVLPNKTIYVNKDRVENLKYNLEQEPALEANDTMYKLFVTEKKNDEVSKFLYYENDRLFYVDVIDDHTLAIERGANTLHQMLEQAFIKLNSDLEDSGSHYSVRLSRVGINAFTFSLLRDGEAVDALTVTYIKAITAGIAEIIATAITEHRKSIVEER